MQQYGNSHAQWIKKSKNWLCYMRRREILITRTQQSIQCQNQRNARQIFIWFILPSAQLNLHTQRHASDLNMAFIFPFNLHLPRHHHSLFCHKAYACALHRTYSIYIMPSSQFAHAHTRNDDYYSVYSGGTASISHWLQSRPTNTVSFCCYHSKWADYRRPFFSLPLHTENKYRNKKKYVRIDVKRVNPKNMLFIQWSMVRGTYIVYSRSRCAWCAPYAFMINLNDNNSIGRITYTRVE